MDKFGPMKETRNGESMDKFGQMKETRNGESMDKFGPMKEIESMDKFGPMKETRNGESMGKFGPMKEIESMDKFGPMKEIESMDMFGPMKEIRKLESMDKFGPMKETRNGETNIRGKVPVDGNMDDCFQSLMTKNPNQKITIHDPSIINTGKADCRAKKETTMEITAQKSSVGEKHMKEASPKEEFLRVKGFAKFSQDKSGHTDFPEYPHTQMESKSLTELHQSKMEVQHTDLEPYLGMIEPQGTRIEALDLSLKNKKKKLQDPCSSTKLLSEESTVAVSSSVKGELTPSSLPTRMQYRVSSRSQPYRIPIRVNKNLTLYGMFKPEFIVISNDGNSSQEMSRRDEDNESGRILDALKVDHIDRPPPEVTLSAYSSVSGQLTIPEMEPNSSKYIHQSRSHDDPLNEMGNAVAVEKATIDTCIPFLDETQSNVNTWHTPKTQSWKPLLRDKLSQKKHNGGTKPFK